MDAQRRIRIPRKAGLEGDAFFLLALGSYRVLFPVPSDKPELNIEGPVADRLAKAEEDIVQDVLPRSSIELSQLCRN